MALKLHRSKTFESHCLKSLRILFQKFGVTAAEVEETLEGGDYQNHLAIAYRLIIDNKHMEEKHAIEEFK